MENLLATFYGRARIATASQFVQMVTDEIWEGDQQAYAHFSDVNILMHWLVRIGAVQGPTTPAADDEAPSTHWTKWTLPAGDSIYISSNGAAIQYEMPT